MWGVVLGAWGLAFNVCGLGCNEAGQEEGSGESTHQGIGHSVTAKLHTCPSIIVTLQSVPPHAGHL